MENMIQIFFCLLYKVIFFPGDREERKTTLQRTNNLFFFFLYLQGPSIGLALVSVKR